MGRYVLITNIWGRKPRQITSYYSEWCDFEIKNNPIFVDEERYEFDTFEELNEHIELFKEICKNYERPSSKTVGYSRWEKHKEDVFDSPNKRKYGYLYGDRETMKLVWGFDKLYRYNDLELRKYFDEDEILLMKEAVEDHRGSRKERPRNFYGECLSDSDRDFEIEVLAQRQLATSLKNYPDLKLFDEQFERCYEYICKRINSAGKFNLWTNNAILVERRDKFQIDYLNKIYAKSIYQEEWNRISSDGTKEKIITYYKDY